MVFVELYKAPASVITPGNTVLKSPPTAAKGLVLAGQCTWVTDHLQL